MGEQAYHDLERAAKELLGFLRFTRDESSSITGAWCVGRYYTAAEFPLELQGLKAAWEQLNAKSMKLAHK